LEVLNRGLIAEHRNAIKESADVAWHTLTDEDEVNGEFTGTIAETKSVNQLVLTLAKTLYGYSKDMSKEQKRAAKENAMGFVKGNNAVKEGLRRSAVASK
jgi:hypothetical protein